MSEVYETGIGGGCVFTMDGITFGLEVCLDHGKHRLFKQCANSALHGEPKVQMQLIRSCGMKIDKPFCVPTGLPFAVDVAHHAAQKNGRGTNINERGPHLTVAAPVPVAHTNYFPAYGKIIFFDPENKPAPDVVP